MISETWALIPARSGSKGVPKKNIRSLGGHPLIAYSIVAAKLSSKIERIILSTDSSEIAEMARSYGAEVPFLRPIELAQDHSSDLDFVRHALNWFEDHEGDLPDFLLHLRPTTPLRDPEVIDSAIEALKSNPTATSLRSAHEVSEPPQKMMGIQDGYLVGLFPGEPRPEYHNLPRQAFPPAYHPNGYVDILKTHFVKKGDSLHGSKILAFATPHTIEVDRLEDLERLEYVLEKQSHLLLDYLESHFASVRRK